MSEELKKCQLNEDFLCLLNSHIKVSKLNDVNHKTIVDCIDYNPYFNVICLYIDELDMKVIVDANSFTNWFIRCLKDDKDYFKRIIEGVLG